MASVDLSEVWLHDAEDLASFVRVAVASIDVTPERAVERRRRAGGRLVVVSGPARPVDVVFTGRHVSRDVLGTIEGWLGRRLLYRDPRGRVLFGFIGDLPTEELVFTDRANIRVAFQSVSGSVEV